MSDVAQAIDGLSSTIGWSTFWLIVCGAFRNYWK
jgi:hypothetical protein